MDARESLRMAWRSIRAHRLRSTLTTLGVIIGVGAVITFVALGASLQGAVVGEFAGQQSPSMTVTTSSGENQSGSWGGGGHAVFTDHDIEQLQSLDGVASVVPEGEVSVSGISSQNQTVALQSMTATTPEYFAQEGNGNFSAGGPFSPSEREVVLNEPAATMFETNVSVGETVTLTRADGEEVNATVVGILESPETSQGGGPFGGAGQSQPAVYGPTDPFYEPHLMSPATGEQQRVYPEVTVVATDFETVDAVEERVTTYLQESSDATELTPDGYSVTVQTNEGFIEQIESTIEMFTEFITGIAVLSLVVGAIGIANIMLVSVTERTREIGIMKSVGAQKGDILQLFLVEAVILGVIGAVAGTLVGGVTAYAATQFIGLPLTFPLEWVGIAIGVGIGVGVASGLYPAWKGARTDPIDALRYE